MNGRQQERYEKWLKKYHPQHFFNTYRSELFHRKREGYHQKFHTREIDYDDKYKYEYRYVGPALVGDLYSRVDAVEYPDTYI